MTKEALDIGRGYEEKYGFHVEEKSVFKSEKGLSHKVIDQICDHKNEPQWMREFRHKSLDIFLSKPLPTWGGKLTDLNFDNIYYYLKPAEQKGDTWEDVPPEIKRTFDKLGIPESEQKFLAGAGAQYESESVYHNLKKEWEDKGVIFSDTDSALKEHPEIFKKFFSTIVPPDDNKFAALNSAVWSGGSFLYVPPGVKVDLPLQAYFRINAKNVGQFERTLLICDEGAQAHYVEGCTAPSYSSDSLHSAVVEVIVMKNARFRYTTIQNWSSNVYNLVTKRSQAFANATMEWVDANLGCLTADSQLFLNPKGPVSIAEVKPGDFVYGTDLNELKPKKYPVSAVRCTGVKKTYRLVTQNFREIKATANHPFLTLIRDPFSAYPKLSWMPLEKLNKGNLIAMLASLPDEGKPYAIQYSYPQIKGRGIKNCVSIPEQTTEEFLWLLGLYLGDGCIERDKKSKRARRVYFAIPPKDRARSRLTSALEKIFNAAWKEKGISVTIGSAVLADFILSLGFNGTAKSKRIPKWIYSLPLKQKLAFIEGYLDSDGCIRRRSAKNEQGQIVFASANRALLEDIKLLMISCGLNPLKISTYKSRRNLYKNVWKEYTTHYLSLNLKENLNRIRAKEIPPTEIQFTRVRAIDPAGEEPVYDIEVEGCHNFIANGLIVHNSKLTMKYPSIYLMEPGARGDILSVAFAGEHQHQDAGGKVIHAAPHTSSHILSKSVSQHGGRSSYRGLVKVHPGCKDVKVNVCCDALLMDKDSRSDTYPYMEIDEKNVNIGHEATVSKVGDEQLFYLRSRGLTEEQANSMIVSGFIEPIVKELPMEYAIEMNRLIQLQMEGSVG